MNALPVNARARPLSAPLTFEPQLKDYVWGGRNLERLFGRRLPPGIVAESWEISAHPSAPTPVDEGPLAGARLPELVARYGTELVGRRGAEAAEAANAAEHRSFPLLFKLLDANQALSVQVHPRDDFAAAHGLAEPGKTEMWYALHAEPGAEVVLGVTPGTDAAALRRAVAENRVEEVLNRVRVRSGDAVFVPAGTVHAILPGLVLVEVQQSSDVTFRLHDWGRPTAEEGGRELHVEQALAAADLQSRGKVIRQETRPRSAGQGAGERGAQSPVLAACKHFAAERITLDAGATYNGELAGGSFEVWGIVSGSVSVGSRGAPPRALNAIRFALLPAAMGEYSVSARVPSVALRVYLP